MRKLLYAAGAIVALLVLAAILLPLLVDAGAFRPVLEGRLSSALGREVTIGDLSLSLLSGGVAATDIAIADDPAFSSDPFLRAGQLSVGVDLPALIFSRELRVTGLTVERPEIVLLQSPDGRWNFASLGSGDQPAAPPEGASEAPSPNSNAFELSVSEVRIRDGRVRLADVGGANARELEQADLEVRDFAPGVTFPFSLSAQVAGGGAVEMDGTAGPLASPASQTPFDARLRVEDLNLAASGFARPESGIDGLIGFKAAASSDGSLLTLTMRFTADRWKLTPKGSPAPQPIVVAANIEYDLSTRQGELIPSAVGIGEELANLATLEDRYDLAGGEPFTNLAGTYDLSGEVPVIDSVFYGNDIQLTQLAWLLPPLDIKLPAGAEITGGTAAVKFLSSGRLDQLTTTAEVTLENVVLSNFSLSSKLQVLQQLAGLPSSPETRIERLDAEATMTPQGTRIDTIQVIAPGIGELTGEGTISPAHELDFHMQLKGRVGGAAAAAAGREEIAGTIPFLIRGTSSDPVFRPDARAIASDQIEETLRDPAGAVERARSLIGLFGGGGSEEEPAAGDENAAGK